MRYYIHVNRNLSTKILKGLEIFLLGGFVLRNPMILEL